MLERKMDLTKMVYGDICQRSMHSIDRDQDVEDFEKEILEALEGLEQE